MKLVHSTSVVRLQQDCNRQATYPCRQFVCLFVCLFVYWRRIAQPTAQGHLRALRADRQDPDTRLRWWRPLFCSRWSCWWLQPMQVNQPVTPDINTLPWVCFKPSTRRTRTRRTNKYSKEEKISTTKMCNLYFPTWFNLYYYMPYII